MDNKATDLKIFGQTLKSLRKEAGFTQDTLAGKLRISADLLSKWERRYRYKDRQWRPKRPQMMRLLEIFSGQLDLEDAQTWAGTAGYKVSQNKLQFFFPSDASPVAAAPRQSPALPPFHISRKQTEKTILEKFNKEKTHTLILQGPGGIGKTTLALWLAQTMSNDFPDGVIMVENQADDDIAGMQEQIARSLRVVLRGNSLNERAGELRSLLYGKRCLLILDDVWAAPELSYLHLANETTRLLLTTRDAKVAQLLNAPIISVPGLSRSEGIALLENWLDEAVSADQAAELVTRLGGLPLALSLSGAQLRAGVKLSELLDILQYKYADLTLLDLDDPQDRAESLTHCFDLSYNRLSPTEQQRFQQLCYFAGSIDRQAIAAVWQIDGTRTRRSLQRLYRLALLKQDARGFHLHPLLRDYAWQKLSQKPGAKLAGQQRYAAWHIRRILYHPGVLDDVTDPAPDLNAHWGDLVSALKWAASREPQLAAYAALLAHTERPALLQDVGPNLLIGVADYLTQTQNKQEQAIFLELLGDLHLLLGEFEAGLNCFNQAGKLWEMREDWLSAGRSKLRAAGAHLLQQNQANAAEAARQAQLHLAQNLPIKAAELERARWLFYWFDMIYTALTRWAELPEKDVAGLAELAQKTDRPILEARGLHIYRLWCTADIPRPAATREQGRALALRAYRLWRACGRTNRADDEISWTLYRLTGRYSQRSAARFARRRSRTTPALNAEQIKLIESEGLRRWLNASEGERIAWLSHQLPRYLGASNAPGPPLSPDSPEYAWVEDILNVGALGQEGRRLALQKPVAPDHILNGPEWCVLSGQKTLPLAGLFAQQLVERCLSDLERYFPSPAEPELSPLFS